MVAATRSREAGGLYHRMEQKLGLTRLRTDRDLARLAEERLPLTTVDALASHGVTDEEIYRFVVPRRTLLHRRTRQEALTQEESDRAIRLARIASLAEEVFGDDGKASRWLRKAKSRFEGRSPLDLLRTEAGARIVEEMLLQIDYGYFA